MPEDQKEPFTAKASLVFMLLCFFVYVTLRGTDVLAVTLLATVVGFTGWILAIVARKRIRHAGGRIGGESLALIGYWGNLILFLLSALWFSYSVAMGILRGDLL